MPEPSPASLDARTTMELARMFVATADQAVRDQHTTSQGILRRFASVGSIPDTVGELVGEVLGCGDAPADEESG
jgi:hypothetical protein